MRTVFADTFYFLALLDIREATHTKAAQFSRNPNLRVITTEWVLAEFGNAYCDPRDRPDFVSLVRALLVHPRVKVIPATSELFLRGFAFFAQRPDKEWSLVDCISFIAMGDEQITEALTGDHHFRQAGFSTLLAG